LRVCLPCHESVTNTAGNRDDYEWFGWIVPREEDSAGRQTLIHGHTIGHAWVWLHDDGGFTWAPEPPRKRGAA
jgi:hypothetical protein